jgi:hypothetical protein
LPIIRSHEDWYFTKAKKKSKGLLQLGQDVHHMASTVYRATTPSKSTDEDEDDNLMDYQDALENPEGIAATNDGTAGLQHSHPPQTQFVAFERAADKVDTASIPP